MAFTAESAFAAPRSRFVRIPAEDDPSIPGYHAGGIRSADPIGAPIALHPDIIPTFR